MRIENGWKKASGGAALGTVVGLVLCGALAGCRFDSHQNGKNDNDVKFATPFGGMSVKTDDAVVQGNVGLSVYPGAVLVKKENNKDSGAADVNMSFGSFHLGVKALEYQSGDAPDKVMAFYRKDMAKYGTVIECHDGSPVGQPVRTQEGLSCSDQQKPHIELNQGSESELKAGSKQHQHIVAIDPKNGGTKIGLVLLDLPGGGFDADDDSKQ